MKEFQMAILLVEMSVNKTELKMVWISAVLLACLKALRLVEKRVHSLDISMVGLKVWKKVERMAD